MALKDTLDKVQRLLPTDAAEDLRAALADAKAEAAIVVDSLEAKNRENQKRRTDNTELTTKLETLTAEIAKLKEVDTSGELKELKAKADRLDALEKKLADEKLSKWDAALAKLKEIPDTDARHPKVDAFLKTLNLPEDGKIEPAQADGYLQLFAAFEAGGGLSEFEKHKGHPPPKTGEPDNTQAMTSGEAVVAMLKKQK